MTPRFLECPAPLMNASMGEDAINDYNQLRSGRS
jgi:hypothetical protein